MLFESVFEHKFLNITKKIHFFIAVIKIYLYLQSQSKKQSMKVRSAIKKRSEDCKIVKRKGKLYVINKKNPRYKQRQG